MALTNGVVAGKWDPFHVGHKALIEEAIVWSEHVDVLLVAHSKDKFAPLIRQASIYETFPNADLTVHIVDDIYTNDKTEISHILWARYTEAILGYLPDRVFASEKYGEGWAEAMGAQAHIYDEPRERYAVSGTLCRENAFKMSEFLPPATKRYVLPRVVVLGAESTGTTTLAEDLGEHYNTVVVPELGRLVSEEAVRAGGTNDDDTWDDARFTMVSRGQDAIEERYATGANGLLICDTDSFATSVWYDYYMRKGELGESVSVAGGLLTDLDIRKWGWKQAEKHCLYILTYDDIPFRQDELGTRTGEHMRRWMTERFEEYLIVLQKSLNIPHIVVKGDHGERVNFAIDTINEVVGA